MSARDRRREERRRERREAADIVPQLVQDIYEDIDDGSTPPPSTNFESSEDTRRIEDRRAFSPLEVNTLEGTGQFTTDGVTLQGGETITDEGFEQPLRIVYGATCTLSQLKTLLEMRRSPEPIRIVSALYSGPVAFDQIDVARIEDANDVVTPGGGTIEEPIYEIQLQNKQNQDGSDA